jgi:hypothetical protein
VETKSKRISLISRITVIPIGEYFRITSMILGNIFWKILSMKILLGDGSPSSVS